MALAFLPAVATDGATSPVFSAGAGEGIALPLVISVLPSAMLGPGLWACVTIDVDGGDSGLPLVRSFVIIVASDFSPASVPGAGTTTTAGFGAKGSGPTAGAGAIGGRVVGADADAADAGIWGNIASWPPPLSLVQVYTVLMMTGVGVIVAFVVYAAAVKVIMGSEVVLGAASGVHAVFGSLEGMISWREVVRTLEVFGIRGSEKVTALWLDDDDAAPPMTVETPGVDSLSALAALAGTSELVGMAATGVLVCGRVWTS